MGSQIPRENKHARVPHRATVAVHHLRNPIFRGMPHIPAIHIQTPTYRLRHLYTVQRA